MKIPSAYGPEQTHRKAENLVGQKSRQDAASVSGDGGRGPGAGIDSVTLAGRRNVQKPVVYSMSELKGKADRALAAQKALKEQRADKPEPLADSRIGATRQELIELTRLRISAGFYNRPDVIDAIAKRIIDNF